MHISTHSAREDGDGKLAKKYLLQIISTHSAREDGDGISIHGFEWGIISTHSAREDGDFNMHQISLLFKNFNPLRPRGRRLYDAITDDMGMGFQPTPPARTETIF